MSVTCPTVTFTAPPSPAPANIVVDGAVQTVPSGTVQYVGGQTISALVRWKNIGASSGSFVPKVVVNGSTILYGFNFGNVSITLAPGATHQDQFNFQVGGAGTYSVCPDPNP